VLGILEPRHPPCLYQTHCVRGDRTEELSNAAPGNKEPRGKTPDPGAAAAELQ